MPHRLGLRLHPTDGAEHADGAVEDAERTFDLGGEIHVAGGVDDVDLVVAPIGRRGGALDGDAALLLCSIQSITASPSSTSPILWLFPV
jgi:hypothetical protein